MMFTHAKYRLSLYTYKYHTAYIYRRLKEGFVSYEPHIPRKPHRRKSWNKLLKMEKFFFKLKINMSAPELPFSELTTTGHIWFSLRRCRHQTFALEKILQQTCR